MRAGLQLEDWACTIGHGSWSILELYPAPSFTRRGLLLSGLGKAGSIIPSRPGHTGSQVRALRPETAQVLASPLRTAPAVTASGRRRASM